ncbi:MAG TPA: hypothetical protein VH989_05560 [Actinomycetota bacterium]|jgi:hypothetical protein
MVAAFGSIWVQSREDGSIWRIGPNGDVVARLPETSTSKSPGRYGSVSQGLAAGFGSVWSLTDDALVRIDPASNTIAATLPIEFPYAIAVGEGAVWVVCCRSRVRLVTVNPSTMAAEVLANLGTSASALGVGNGSVWWGRASEGGGMYRVDPKTGAFADMQAGYNDRFIVSTPRWLWLVDSGRAQRIDPAGSRSSSPSKKLADQSIGASYSHGTVWINGGAAVGFDANSGAVTSFLPAFTIHKYWLSGGIAQLDDRVWLADPEGDRVLGLALA